jgi:hypothetical protein
MKGFCLVFRRGSRQAVQPTTNAKEAVMPRTPRDRVAALIKDVELHARIAAGRR